MVKSNDLSTVILFLPTILMLLRTILEMMFTTEEGFSGRNDGDFHSNGAEVRSMFLDMNVILSLALHSSRLQQATALLSDELGFWVLPRSTTWFSQFCLTVFDDNRWIELFRMSKAALFNLSTLLKPHIERQDTRYRKAIPVSVRVAAALFKLTQGASFLLCSELFAIGKSTVCRAIREFVIAVNVELRREIAWPRGSRMVTVMNEFKHWCGLPAVIGAIDCTHFHIRKPTVAPEDYYFFKTGGYSLTCQAVVNSQKRFLDVYVGMPGSTNDSRVLRTSSLYREATSNNLFDPAFAQDGFAPYLLGDKGYPLLPWIMTPYRDQQGGNRSLIEVLYNRKHRKGRTVIENAFGILKHTFRELLDVSDLHVTLVPDVVICCCLLHNILLGQSPDQVDCLLEVIQREGPVQGQTNDDHVMEWASTGPPTVEFRRGDQKRAKLGLYLASQRNLPI